jgi:hypothetical protein
LTPAGISEEKSVIILFDDFEKNVLCHFPHKYGLRAVKGVTGNLHGN